MLDLCSRAVYRLHHQLDAAVKGKKIYYVAYIIDKDVVRVEIYRHDITGSVKALPHAEQQEVSCFIGHHLDILSLPSGEGRYNIDQLPDCREINLAIPSTA